MQIRILFINKESGDYMVLDVNQKYGDFSESAIVSAKKDMLSITREATQRLNDIKSSVPANITCNLYESGNITFTKFIDRLQEDYLDFKEEMRTLVEEHEVSSYVVTEASARQIMDTIAAFIRKAVDAIVSAAQSFYRSVVAFIKRQINKQQEENKRSKFNMNFDFDPFSNIHEYVFDYRSIDQVVRDKMRFLSPLDINHNMSGDDTVAYHISTITNSQPRLFYRDDDGYQTFLFGKVPLNRDYVCANRIVDFFNTIQKASEYSLRNSAALRQICNNNINKFNDLVSTETDPDMLKYFNDIKNSVAAVMDFDMNMHNKQMRYIQNAIIQVQRIQSIYNAGNGATA